MCERHRDPFLCRESSEYYSSKTPLLFSQHLLHITWSNRPTSKTFSLFFELPSSNVPRKTEKTNQNWLQGPNEKRDENKPTSKIHSEKLLNVENIKQLHGQVVLYVSNTVIWESCPTVVSFNFATLAHGCINADLRDWVPVLIRKRLTRSPQSTLFSRPRFSDFQRKFKIIQISDETTKKIVQNLFVALGAAAAENSDWMFRKSALFQRCDWCLSFPKKIVRTSHRVLHILNLLQSNGFSKVVRSRRLSSFR